MDDIVYLFVAFCFYLLCFPTLAQVIPETSNLFLLKTSSVSLQSSASLRPQPKVMMPN